MERFISGERLSVLLCRDTNTLVRLGVVIIVVGCLVDCVVALLVLKIEVCNDDVMLFV